jgi:hypothetical protein
MALCDCDSRERKIEKAFGMQQKYKILHFRALTQNESSSSKTMKRARRTKTDRPTDRQTRYAFKQKQDISSPHREFRIENNATIDNGGYCVKIIKMKGHSNQYSYSPATDEEERHLHLTAATSNSAKVESSEGLSLLLLTLFFIVGIVLCAQLNCMIENRREAYYDKRDRDRRKEKG